MGREGEGKGGEVCVWDGKERRRGGISMHLLYVWDDRAVAAPWPSPAPEDPRARRWPLLRLCLAPVRRGFQV